MNRKKKYIFILLGMLILLGLCFEAYKMRGGKWIHATKDFEVSPKIVCYKQKDARWEKDTLGDSAYTLGGSGCLVSCMASIYSLEQNTNMTPQDLNQLYSDHGVYQDGNVMWEQLASFHITTERLNHGFDAGMIESYLEKGVYPIVRVEVPITCRPHYVLIVGARDGDFLCMDPLDDHITTLSKYWNRIYAVRIFTTLECGGETIAYSFLEKK